MVALIFNFPGLAMVAAAFGSAFGLGKLIGVSGEGPLMIIAGPLVAAFDIGYRWRTKPVPWFVANRGGSLFFLPAWCFGALWLVLGIVYTVGARGAAHP